MQPHQFHIQRIDHMGLVAGMCKELGIATLLDSLVPNQSGNRNISFGETVVSMLLNGLGFNARTLHMFPEFHADKPLDKLIRPGIEPEHINDSVLGRALDQLFELGVSEVYLSLAVKAVNVLKLPCKALNLDSTSLHVDGVYNSESDVDEEDMHCIKICRGYSRDHRPELNQAILLMMTENQAGIPVFMAASSGNVNDNKNFKKVISKHLKSYREALNNHYLIGDAALYTTDNVQILQQQEQQFITRVPSKIKEAKELIDSVAFCAMTPVEGAEGYECYEVLSDHADVPQRWTLVRSEQARKSEQKTLLKKMLKKTEKEAEALTSKLARKAFKCETDALRAFNEWQSKSIYCQAEPVITAKPCYTKVGRPEKDSKPDSMEYFVSGHPWVSVDCLKEAECSLGCFVLATNDLDENRLSSAEVLSTYKSQQSVERGFRFLKSPDFLVSSLFLKKPERIEALLMVMTLCLLVYAAIQHRIRHELKRQSRFFPDMKRKPCQNPTARWVFFCFQGINVLLVDGHEKHVVGLQERQLTIVSILGRPYQEIYS
ncbi:MAG: IS1634 family transposase [Shewanella sp.]|nr:IS1634 family transposase [Shewanella sp.]